MIIETILSISLVLMILMVEDINTQYRITSISGLKEFEVEPLDAESPGITTTGLGIDVCSPRCILCHRSFL